METYEKTERNDLCPCGSGRKHKKCCLIEKNRNKRDELKKFYENKYNIKIKSQKDIDGIRKAGKLVIATLNMVEKKIKPGITTDYINDLVHEFTIKNGAIPAPLNYNGFPKSVCVSVNEVVCHGIPSKRVIKEGDIANIDVTSILDGYYADANKTFFVGKKQKKAERLVDITRESLKRAIAKIKPGNRLGDIGWAIQEYAEKNGCSVVREFVGHGVGLSFHEPPQVPHFGREGAGVPLVAGMVFTVEPMINLGKKDVRILKDNWTVITRDGKLSAQFEQTFLVTDKGCESLTPYEL